MTGADRLSLAGLDQAPVVELDPSIWEHNLGALRLQSPQFAAELEVALPSTGAAFQAWTARHVPY